MDPMPPAVSASPVATPASPAFGRAAHGGNHGADRGADHEGNAAGRPAQRVLPPPPETLHPSLWLGHQLGRQAENAVSSGFPALDAELPGGGWPRRVLSELLLPHPGVGEMRLLSRSLAAVQQTGRLVMLFDPPETLCAWALAQMGLDVDQLLVVNTRCKVVAGSDSLWALEQALKSGHVGAVLAWLPPRLRAERLRRLQLAAHAHDGPAFVIREMAAQQRPTAAPLRLALKPGGADMLNLRVLKRRGPPLESPLRLALPPVLSAAARQRAGQGIDAPGQREGVLSQVLPAATFINLAS
jgi:protein ImuA